MHTEMWSASKACLRPRVYASTAVPVRALSLVSQFFTLICTRKYDAAHAMAVLGTYSWNRRTMPTTIQTAIFTKPMRTTIATARGGSLRRSGVLSCRRSALSFRDSLTERGIPPDEAVAKSIS
ncbi:hypothetical protein MRB53_037103 [Persea americana]|nr:hypothetical protein MRB53_037103 [Persea americana]